MIILLSPAKTLDFDSPAKTTKHSQPVLLNEAALLVNELSQLPPKRISSLMKISDQLGQLNAERFKHWQQPFTPANAKQAVLAFQGDVYTGMEAETFRTADFNFAQRHLRILSGLYGLLKPLDLIQPYRLEMGTVFNNQRGRNLYEFWGEQLTKQLNQDLKKAKSSSVVNLASNEYFKAIKPKLLDAEVITPIFKDAKNGNYKVISFYAKKARGMMAAYMIKNQVSEVNTLKKFNAGGYQFNRQLSSNNELIFTRAEQRV